MNKKAILQELYKKIARMDKETFRKLIKDLLCVYNKTHKEEIGRYIILIDELGEDWDD